MKRKPTALIVPISFLLVLVFGNAFADFYKYTAKDGTVHFVDDISKVPGAYRNQIQQYEETVSSEPPGETGIAPGRDGKTNLPDIDNSTEAPVMETRVEVYESHILVPVKLGDGRTEIDLMMVMDTGSAKMVLAENVARQLYLAPLGNVTMVAADGRRVKTAIGLIENMELGPFTLKNVPAVIMPDDNEIGYSGLLGFEVLRNFNYTLDMKQGVIRWEPLPEVPVTTNSNS